MIEKNHEYIRLVLPKGTSFNGLCQDDVTLVANHINSETRDSLNGASPIQLSRLLQGDKLLDHLRFHAVPPDDVNLTPKLLRP